MKRHALAIALSVMLATSSSMARGLSESIPFGGHGPFERLDLTGPRGRSTALLTHQRNRARATHAPASDSHTFGDVVVLIDNGRINGPRPANPVDLSFTNVTFTPAAGDEDDDGLGNDVKTMAFVLLVERGEPGAQAAAVRQVENFRRAWQLYSNGPATGGRGRFDTSLDPAVF